MTRRPGSIRRLGGRLARRSSAAHTPWSRARCRTIRWCGAASDGPVGGPPAAGTAPLPKGAPTGCPSTPNPSDPRDRLPSRLGGGREGSMAADSARTGRSPATRQRITLRTQADYGAGCAITPRRGHWAVATVTADVGYHCALHARPRGLRRTSDRAARWTPPEPRRRTRRTARAVDGPELAGMRGAGGWGSSPPASAWSPPPASPRSSSPPGRRHQPRQRSTTPASAPRSCRRSTRARPRSRRRCRRRRRPPSPRPPPRSRRRPPRRRRPPS